VWLFGIAELVSYNFRTILHFADECDEVISHLILLSRDNIEEHSDLHHFESNAEHLELFHSVLAHSKY
jgi:hypothetical protein